MFNYDTFLKKLQKNASEKLTNAVYAVWYGNTIRVLIIGFVLLDLFYILIGKIISVAIIYWLILLVEFCYFATRKAAIAISENRILYVKFKHIGYSEKDIFEINTERIKSISVSKFLMIHFVKISFLSELGRLEKIKVMFSSSRIGTDKIKYKKNSKELFDKLVSIQKVIDRGDF